MLLRPRLLVEMSIVALIDRTVSAEAEGASTRCVAAPHRNDFAVLAGPRDTHNVW